MCPATPASGSPSSRPEVGHHTPLPSRGVPQSSSRTHAPRAGQAPRLGTPRGPGPSGSAPGDRPGRACPAAAWTNRLHASAWNYLAWEFPDNHKPGPAGLFRKRRPASKGQPGSVSSPLRTLIRAGSAVSNPYLAPLHASRGGSRNGARSASRTPPDVPAPCGNAVRSARPGSAKPGSGEHARLPTRKPR
jgi:hypothetical protein